MIDYDRIPEEIERLHMEAEDLADVARHCTDARKASEYREDAKRKIRQAARLRAQIGDDL